MTVAYPSHPSRDDPSSEDAAYVSSASARVLVVEDDAGLQELLVTELEEHGMGARGVAKAGEAVGIIDRWRPDLIVSDLRLPDRSGIDLLEKTRAMRASQRPAFVLITAFGSIDQAVDALKRGADDFLTKPLDLDHLRIRVERLLEVQRLRREVERRHRPVTDLRFSAEPNRHGPGAEAR